jgi:hypothetical protein
MFKHSFPVLSAATLLMASSLSAFAADFPSGTYEANGLVVTFASNGKFHGEQGKETKITGTYAVSGDKVKFTDLGGPWACKKPNQTGTYSWKTDGGALTFTKVSDACEDRVGSITHSSWQPHKAM